MNEIQLSNDLYQIELEINHHKNIAGQSIWEIGRRLNHVKENDLSHGEFSKWLEKVEINQSTANKMMRITKELPNSYTSTNLGLTALDLISSLPQGERTKEHVTEKGETKTPDEMTVRELQKLTKEIKEKDERIANLSEAVKEMANQKPKVIEKVVTKEVIPPKYENLESDNQQLIQTLKEAQEKEKKAIEAAKKANDHYNKLLESRAETEENSEKYKQLTEAIRTAQSNLNDKQKLISNYQSLGSLLRTSNEFLSKASALVYQDLSEVISSDGLAKQELEFLVERTERFLTDLRKQINKKDIIEGEIING